MILYGTDWNIKKNRNVHQGNIKKLKTLPPRSLRTTEKKLKEKTKKLKNKKLKDFDRIYMIRQDR